VTSISWLAPLVEKTKTFARVAPGDSQCIHLRGPGGGRVCIVQVVLGSQLVGNSQVRKLDSCYGCCRDFHGDSFVCCPVRGPCIVVGTAGWKTKGLHSDSQCIHLRGPGGGRVCIVQVVLGSQLVRNSQIREVDHCCGCCCCRRVFHGNSFVCCLVRGLVLWAARLVAKAKVCTGDAWRLLVHSFEGVWRRPGVYCAGGAGVTAGGRQLGERSVSLLLLLLLLLWLHLHANRTGGCRNACTA
jgi:hypothetical protein